jgi:type I restriction enzyme S subunit
MKYQRYPAYKDSGVEWIGEIPEHWKLTKLKSVCHFNYGDSLPTEDRLEGEFPVFGSNGIIDYNSLANTGSPTIIIGRKGSYGKLFYSSLSGFAIDTTFFVNEKTSKVNLKWLYYVLGILHLDM